MNFLFSKISLVICFLFLCCPFSLFSQFLEFGGGVGVTNYTGDLVRGFDINTSKPAGFLNTRFNFSEFTTFKIELLYGGVKGKETPIDPFAVKRNYSFNNQFLELSSNIEYYFLNFKDRKSLYNYSPYIYIGAGMIYMSNSPTKKIQPIIPFGAGFKYLIDKRYTVGFEIGARKTFFDGLDNISDGDLAIKDYQYGNPNDTDWYIFTGISFSYILFEIPCPYPYTPNKGIFSK